MAEDDKIKKYTKKDIVIGLEFNHYDLADPKTWPAKIKSFHSSGNKINVEWPCGKRDTHSWSVNEAVRFFNNEVWVAVKPKTPY